MNVRRLLLASALLLTAGCASARRDAALDHYRPCTAPEGCITFNVSGPAAEHAVKTPVFLATAAGVRQVGTTDEDGIFLAPKKIAKDALALLFCWDARSLACAAVRLDNGDAAAYDWLNVTLPANRLLHRSQARAANRDLSVPLPPAPPPPSGN